MSGSLHVVQPDYDRLPDGHDCKACPSNCCDPVTYGWSLDFPLPFDHPAQVISRNAFRRLVQPSFTAQVRTIMKRQTDQMRGKTPDQRFHPKGFLILPPAPEDMPFIRQREGVEIAYFRALLLGFFRCTAFDAESRVCRDRDGRPDICRDTDPQECGFSLPRVPRTPQAIERLAFYRERLRVLASLRPDTVLDNLMRGRNAELDQFCLHYSTSVRQTL